MEALKKSAGKKKGRGFDNAGGHKSNVKSYEALEDDNSSAGPQRSVEVIFLNFF